MEAAFKMPELSSRGPDIKSLETFKFQKKFYNLCELAELHGFTEPGRNPGLGRGSYTPSHKSLRQNWHQTVMKMTSRNELVGVIGWATSGLT